MGNPGPRTDRPSASSSTTGRLRACGPAPSVLSNSSASKGSDGPSLPGRPSASSARPRGRPAPGARFPTNPGSLHQEGRCEAAPSRAPYSRHHCLPRPRNPECWPTVQGSPVTGYRGIVARGVRVLRQCLHVCTCDEDFQVILMQVRSDHSPSGSVQKPLSPPLAEAVLRGGRAFFQEGNVVPGREWGLSQLLSAAAGYSTAAAAVPRWGQGRTVSLGTEADVLSGPRPECGPVTRGTT